MYRYKLYFSWSQNLQRLALKSLLVHCTFLFISNSARALKPLKDENTAESLRLPTFTRCFSWSDNWRNACQSLIRCEPVDYVSLATLHERAVHWRPSTRCLDCDADCRSHLCPGSDPREGQAWLGYEWSRTTSNQWTLVFTPPGGKQMTVRNGIASWAQQRSSRSRLWRERETRCFTSSATSPAPFPNYCRLLVKYAHSTGLPLFNTLAWVNH